ncbi:vacuolar membrane protein pep3 [Paracoccidioides lutzii Pb01]|uniref:Vacuolar membrane protein pep3 n=1 Tax=Paracoccidioides lutzii (strain ATCC MYA-826 / Pb01) TaxID=502779 RepID=C1GPK2_PARBA|nr:vacuolar membrane protein pep3 [Paracoccidioides lutzii Pb01]EEH36124.2 vacuolar membrane protein pep3 [Paracoccidioides lutzii Pb01]
MALDGSSGYVAASSLAKLTDTSAPIFNVERVQLKFSIATDFVAAQVANNVLILALASRRILRIDLDNAEDIDDVDLPRKSSETGLIRRMFLDPTASHLIITTTHGENYYLHNQSRQPKALPRLKGVSIESIAWNPSLPTASTREILVGASDGNVYEVYIEPLSEFYRRDERYVNSVYKIPGSSVTGIWVGLVPGSPDYRSVILSSHRNILYFMGRVGKHGKEGGSSIFADLFHKEAPLVHEVSSASLSAPSLLAMQPDPPEDRYGEGESTGKQFAWLTSQGVFYGTVPTTPSTPELGERIFDKAKLLPRSILPASESARGGRKLIQDPIEGMTLTQWHILTLVEGRIVAANRLNGEIVYDQAVLERGESSLGLVSDQKKNTHWLFVGKEIYEIAANDEDRDIWKMFLKEQQFDAALRYARGAAQKDAVATASGDYLASKGQYLEAASVWGKSSKSFEEVCLTFMNKGEQDALRKYLLTQMSTYKKSAIMQRTMIASWLVEVFMSKLNSLDDTIATKAELVEGTNAGETRDALNNVRAEFQDFVMKYKSELDPKTVYDIVGSHGREEELLYFATAINDCNFVLSYWIQREKWSEALNVLKKQTNPDVFYKYSSVLMTHVPPDLVDILMRQIDLDPQKLIPALLSYNNATKVPLSQNQAIRYLNFIIANHPNPSAAVHNTFISIHASHPSSSEAALLSYLSSQPSSPPPYDADFALRLCIQHNRVQSCVHIYTTMCQYLQAVELALKHNDIELAAYVADLPNGNDKLRKKLWLLVAEKKIRQPGTGIKDAIEFLRRCELLRIEDLIPFFPDFVVVDDFKDEICSALEDYSRHIDSLRQEMDNSAHTAEQIQNEIAALDLRYAIVEPGEKCWICSLPLLSRQFFVFPCQHAFHSDCLGKKILEAAGSGKRKRIRDLQLEMSKETNTGGKREKVIRDLDGLIAEACILCGEYAIKQIDEPFISAADNRDEWAI